MTIVFQLDFHPITRSSSWWANGLLQLTLSLLSICAAPPSAILSTHSGELYSAPPRILNPKPPPLRRMSMWWISSSSLQEHPFFNICTSLTCDHPISCNIIQKLPIPSNIAEVSRYLRWSIFLYRGVVLIVQVILRELIPAARLLVQATLAIVVHHLQFQRVYLITLQYSLKTQASQSSSVCLLHQVKGEPNLELSRYSNSQA